MSENREEILADFQACTGIEDLSVAINHLDEANWDLLRAVSHVMPPDSQSFQPDKNDPDVMIVDEDNSPAMPLEGAQIMDTDVNIVQNFYANKIHAKDIPEFCQPSTSSGASRHRKMIKFNIQYGEKLVSIDLSDSSTIGDLKRAIEKKFNISPCLQKLTGWNKNNINENAPFSQFIYNREITLLLNVQNKAEGFTSEEENEMTERLNGTFTLNIKCEDEDFSLKFPGSSTVLSVKTGLNSVTNIEVRNQLWSGWPPNIDGHTLIALSGINYPEHNFTVTRCPTVTNSNKEKKNISIIKIDSDDDDFEEFEDASESFNVDDDFFVEEVGTRKTEPLIPDNVEDEIVGSLTFIERFTARYGPIHPAFFQGTLEEAIQEACNKPAKDRKILAIYLHHDASVLTNVFCTQLLGFESVMQIFENNFVLWGWDLTFESNLNRLQQSVAHNLGAVAAMSLRNMPSDRLPALVQIMRIRSSTDIFSVVHGNVGVNELLSSLIEAVEVFTEHQRVEMREEQERAERELVKWEQDQAYRESLEADRAKEEAKRNKEQAEIEARVRRESEHAEELRKKEEHRSQVEKELPPEPPLDQGDKDIIKIRFRLPQGKSMERRFHINSPVKILLDFLIVKGYPTDEYKVIYHWPRRDMTTLDQQKTLKELDLCPQETVILEER